MTLWPNGRLRLMVSGVCNAHCPHCHNEGIESTTHFMHPRVVELFAEIATQQRDCFQTVTFSGGEPLLHPQITDLCTIVSSCSRGITIPTNAICLTDKRISELSIAGVSRIRIDIDPWRFERSVDGENNLNKKEIIERITSIRNAGIQVALNTVLTGYAVTQIRDLLLFCEEERLAVKIFERATRSSSSGRLISDPEVPFSVLQNIVHELFPSALHCDDGPTGADVIWHGTPFKLRYCCLLCATGTCKMSGIRCAPDGRLAVCVNQFGPERIDVTDSADEALVKIMQVERRTCIK